jgi:hypothetical protein
MLAHFGERPSPDHLERYHYLGCRVPLGVLKSKTRIENIFQIVDSDTVIDKADRLADDLEDRRDVLMVTDAASRHSVA